MTITMTEILWIRSKLEQQGCKVQRTAGGLWVIRGLEDMPMGVMSRDAERAEWISVLMVLAVRGWIIWPPQD